MKMQFKLKKDIVVQQFLYTNENRIQLSILYITDKIKIAEVT